MIVGAKMTQMTLSNLNIGDLAKILAIGGGKGIRQKLLLRGVSEGSIIRVVSSNGGPVVIEGNSGMIAIGRGMAKRIIVEKR